jgi:hypothetical protein
VKKASTSPRKYEPMRDTDLASRTPSVSRTVRKVARRVSEDEGDMTLDIGAIMAKIGKPKRMSGTEESFVDLLHGDDRPNELDMLVHLIRNISL